MGDVIRGVFPLGRPDYGNHRASARPEIGQVRITIDNIEHHLSASDALLLAAEICASAADAYERERTARDG